MAGPRVSENPDCPQWERFLLEATGGDPELYDYMKRAFGYCASGDTSEHALLFVHGDGGNGKTTALNTIVGIMGDYAATAPMDTFTVSIGTKHPTDIASLHKARLATASETQEGRAWDEARIKQLTGGDPIAARYMYGNFFTFQPEFTLLIVGNHKPELRHVDEAIRRRFKLIPFTQKPETPDPHLQEKLCEEWPGILRWIIEGFQEWQEHGLQTPESVAEATNAYFEDQDLIGQWIADKCVSDPGNEYRFGLSGELYRSWQEFATAIGEEPGSQKRFSESMKARGFSRERKKIGRGFVGIELETKHW